MPDPFQLLYDTSFATAIRESEVVFPVLESVHVLSLALMVGTIAIVDLRLLGLVLPQTSPLAVERRIVPLTWVGFVVMAATGSLLFAAEAAKLEHNPAFIAKAILLLLAGLNMLVFQWGIKSGLQENAVPLRARMGAAASLTLWAGTVAAGRAIAYFH